MWYAIELMVENIMTWPVNRIGKPRIWIFNARCYAVPSLLLGVSALNACWGDAGQAPGTPECFYTLPGTTCEETSAIIKQGSAAAGAAARAASSPDAMPWLATANTEHAQSAELHVAKYYSTQEVIDMAAEYLKGDLEVLGYPKLKLSSASV